MCATEPQTLPSGYITGAALCCSCISDKQNCLTADFYRCTVSTNREALFTDSRQDTTSRSRGSLLACAHQKKGRRE